MTASDDGDREPTRIDRVVAVGIGAALSFGTLAQGAYHPAGLRPVLLLVAVAVTVAAVSAVVTRRGHARSGVLPRACWPALALGAFALWALAVGALRGDVRAAVPLAAVAVCVGAVGVTVAGLPARSRGLLQGTVVGLGVLVAASAWVGVAFRLPPLALPSSGLWRGASTLTYANATAAFLTIALFVAVTVLPSRRASNWILAVLLLGMLTTMSRAGALALLIGAAAHLVLAPDRARLRAAVPAVPAAAVAGIGLLPSVPTASPAQPLVALVAVAVAVLVAAPRMTRAYAAAAAATVLAAGLGALALPVVRDALLAVRGTRLSTVSAERGDLSRVTLEQWASAPVLGVGPGGVDLRYVDHTGAPVRAVYTHNEYLQIATETGLVGLVFVVAGLVALAAGGWSRSTSGAAVVAIVAAFAVHSAFDYLWHVPVLPLLLVLAVTSLSAVRDGRRTPIE